MNEEFLHYIWKYRLYEAGIRTVTGEPVSVIEPGMHNRDAGPDFLNARIRIGQTLWAGNVEIHTCSSLWNEHKHNDDKAYDNIILHVVLNDDQPVKRKNGEAIPTIELKGKFDNSLYEKYIYFLNNKHWIPCEKLIHKAGRLIINSTLDKMLVERLEDKSGAIMRRLEQNGNNYEQTFYEFLASNFGFKVNSTPFEMTARSLPILYLSKNKNNLFALEALIFGQAGLLGDSLDDEYYTNLKKEYDFQKQKYGLIPIDKHLWRFLRLRPSNFPTIRLSQFANLIYNSSHLFSKILEIENFNNLIPLFNVSVSEYWETHYTFGKESSKRKKNIGKNAIYLIMINTIIPFLFVYGRLKNKQEYIDRALSFLDKIPGESNAIIRKWKELGLGTRTAYNTQALLQLKNRYCNLKKCLHCSIGNVLLKRA